MVLAMCPPDNCACSKDQEPAAIGQEQADRHIPDDAECHHLTCLFSEYFQNKPLVNPVCGGRSLKLFGGGATLNFRIHKISDSPGLHLRLVRRHVTSQPLVAIQSLDCDS